MTISTTSSSTTQQGNGSTTVWTYSFLIPASDDLVVTLTTIADGSTEVLDPAVYTVTGLDDPNGGTVTYPTVGSPITSALNITIQRVLALTQDVDLVNQTAFYPDVVEGEFDYLTMLCQQLQEQINLCLAFPVGATDTSVETLMTAILNGAANAAAAAASAAAAAASAASIAALLPLQTANIGDLQVTNAKLAALAVGALNIATSSLPLVNMINGEIVESRAANAVTFAIKTVAGSDPSATDPVIFIFRNVTPGTGTPVVVTRTTAMSLTVPAGATLGFSSFSAGPPVVGPGRVWLVVFNDSGTLRLGAINCRNGTSIYPLQAFGVASATAIDTASDNPAVIYAGAAVTTKAFTVIGYASYESGLTTAGNWDAAPTRLQLYGLGTPLPGSDVQRAETFTGAIVHTSTNITYDDSIPQITEGAEMMTRAITPSSTANLLVIEHVGTYGTNTGTGTMVIVALFQDAIANALAVGIAAISTAINPSSIFLSWSMLAGTASSTTFRIRAASPAAVNTTLNGANNTRAMGGAMASFIRVREIMA